MKEEEKRSNCGRKGTYLEDSHAGKGCSPLEKHVLGIQNVPHLIPGTSRYCWEEFLKPQRATAITDNTACVGPMV